MDHEQEAEPQGGGFMSTCVPYSLDDDAPMLEPGTRLGAWEVLGPINSGSMGAVFRAQRADGLYEQQVAVKLIRGLSDASIDRFELERQRLARMDHPGIAAILDGGTAPDNRPYMVMALVEGLPIDQALLASHASVLGKVACFRRLCDAIAHAHERLILHRDIKPDNVLVDKIGQPRLIDFGIAEDLAVSDARNSGALTPRYAAPELLRGQPASVATDIFALGVLLHHLISDSESLRAADGSLALLPSEIGDADLRAIIVKATAADPNQRYSAVGLLAVDLDAWRERRPVAARNGGRLYRVGKFLRRFPVGSALAATTITALVVGLSTSIKFGRDAQREAERARQALTQAEYQYQKADAFLNAQTVLNDLLQAAYAGEGDQTDALTELLMGRWRDAHEDFRSGPAETSALAFALGRNLYSRRDYTSAMEVLQQWLDAGYGSQILRDAGAFYLALAMYDAGHYQQALPLLRDQLDHTKRYRFPAPDRFNLASRIANMTNTSEDAAVAEDIFADVIAEAEGADLDPDQRMNLHATAYQQRLRGKDYPAAALELERIIELCDQHPEAAPAMRATARTHLARVYMYALEDYDRVEQIARSIISEDVRRAGESISTAHGYMFLADVLRERGRYDDATEALDQARALNMRFAEADSLGTVPENVIRARILIGKQRSEEAHDLLVGVATRWQKDNPSPTTLPADLVLSLMWAESVLGRQPSEFTASYQDVLYENELKDIHTRWIHRRVLALR